MLKEKKTSILSLALSLLLVLSPGAVYSQDASLSSINTGDLKQSEQRISEKMKSAQDAWMVAKEKKLTQKLPAFDWSNLPVPVAPQKPIPGLESLFKKQIAQTQSSPDSLYKIAVFISFSIPEESLKKVFRESIPLQDRIVFILKGYDESKNMMKTMGRLKRLMPGFSVAVNIDPEQFDRFGINSAPAVVVYKNDPTLEQACVLEGKNPDTIQDEFIGVYGDVSLTYALEHLLKSPALSQYKRTGMPVFLKKSLNKIEPSLNKVD